MKKLILALTAAGMVGLSACAGSAGLVVTTPTFGVTYGLTPAYAYDVTPDYAYYGPTYDGPAGVVVFLDGPQGRGYYYDQHHVVRDEHGVHWMHGHETIHNRGNGHDSHGRTGDPHERGGDHH